MVINGWVAVHQKLSGMIAPFDTFAETKEECRKRISGIVGYLQDERKYTPIAWDTNEADEWTLRPIEVRFKDVDHLEQEEIAMEREYLAKIAEGKTLDEFIDAMLALFQVYIKRIDELCDQCEYSHFGDDV